MAGGVGGVPPQNQRRGRAATPCNPATSGTQNPGKPSANGGGKRGVQGGKAPMAGGVGGVPPQNQRRGRAATPLQPRHEWGPKTLANPQPTGVGNWGSRGAKPPWRGAWGVSRGRSPHGGGRGGCPPTKPKKGASRHPLQPRHEWDPKPQANPQPTGVGKRGWGKIGKRR
jgi:hypothetical protein